MLLRDYLRVHPDDDLRDEGSGLYMKLMALPQTALPPVAVKTHPTRERGA